MVLVVDAAAQSRSVAALVARLRRLRPAHPRSPGWSSTGSRSARHEQLLRDALGPAGLPVLGAISGAERHRHALPPPGPGPGRRARAAARQAVGRAGRPDRRPAAPRRLLALAAAAPRPSAGRGRGTAVRRRAGSASRVRAARPGSPSPRRRRVHLRLCRDRPSCCRGRCRGRPFDPLHDEDLPGGTRGLVHRRRLPRGPRGRSCPPTSRCARGSQPRRPGRADRRRMRRPALPRADPGRLADVRRPRRRRPHDRSSRSATGARWPPPIRCSRGRATCVRGHEFHRTAVHPAGRPPARRWQLRRRHRHRRVRGRQRRSRPICICTGPAGRRARSPPLVEAARAAAAGSPPHDCGSSASASAPATRNW